MGFYCRSKASKVRYREEFSLYLYANDKTSLLTINDSEQLSVLNFFFRPLSTTYNERREKLPIISAKIPINIIQSLDYFKKFSAPRKAQY